MNSPRGRNDGPSKHLNDFSHVILRPATQDYINSVAFSPDGQWLAAALQTHEVEIWNVPERRQAERLRGHAGEVNAVGYSPDRMQLASGSLDGTICIWKPHPLPVAKLIPDAVLQFYFGVGRPRFSPDSRWLAAGITNGDVHIVDPKTADWNVRMVLPDAGLPFVFSGDCRHAFDPHHRPQDVTTVECHLGGKALHDHPELHEYSTVELRGYQL
jgi:WD40 repeat protein